MRQNSIFAPRWADNDGHAQVHESMVYMRLPLRSTSKQGRGASAKDARAIKPRASSTVGSRGPTRRGKTHSNVVHPITTQASHAHATANQGAAHTPRQLFTRGYTVTVHVLHALDLHNPCAIRSCPHAFLPVVNVSINDTPGDRFAAAQHVRNHSSWSKTAITILHCPPPVVAVQDTPVCTVQLSVVGRCTRRANEPVLVGIGRVDAVHLSVDASKDYTHAQFYPVYRYHRVNDKQTIKYIAGKVKLRVQIALDPEIPPEIPPPRHQSDSPAHSPSQRMAPARPVLPFNLGQALQAKRQQLKTTVVPEVVNVAAAKAVEESNLAQQLLSELEDRCKKYLLRCEDLQILNAIGEGVHAAVFRAKRLLPAPHSSTVDVAVKEFRYQRTLSNVPPVRVLEAFRQEFEMLVLVHSIRSYSKRQPYHIIELVGVVLVPKLMIATEYCGDGSLASCMQNEIRWSGVPIQSKTLLALQIAQGLVELHELRIVHRDIKPHNIMISALSTTHPIAKIGDLGSAVMLNPKDSEGIQEETGSSGYTAPEVFQGNGYDEKVDIWSFSIVLWELLTSSADVRRNGNPFLALCGDSVVQKARDGVRPPLNGANSGVSNPMTTLLNQCWAFDAACRPSATQIVSVLQKHLDLLLIGSES